MKCSSYMAHIHVRCVIMLQPGVHQGFEIVASGIIKRNRSGLTGGEYIFIVTHLRLRVDSAGKCVGETSANAAGDNAYVISISLAHKIIGSPTAPRTGVDDKPHTSVIDSARKRMLAIRRGGDSCLQAAHVHYLPSETRAPLIAVHRVPDGAGKWEVYVVVVFIELVRTPQ